MTKDPPCKLRLGRLRERVKKAGLQGVVVAPGPNLLYYTGVRSQLLERPFLFFLPATGEPHLVAPTLEAGPFVRAPVPMQVHGWDDATGPTHAFDSLRRAIELDGNWGCEDRVPFGYLRHVLRTGKTNLVSAEPILQSIREVKEPGELSSLKRAADILVSSYLKVPALIRHGMTELELSRALREEIFANGGESVEFCLVQAGRNAADPHLAPGSKKIADGEGIVIDAGCTYSGYNADITRTFACGTDRKLESVYGEVLEAEEKGILAAGVGVPVGQVDAAARDHLSRKGLGGYFIHRTGHGLGLEEHEQPYIVQDGKENLESGMVFTVEPGVYIPGKLGVRIEDNLVVTARGSRVITGSLPKAYGWWKR